jgi:hypothetical protein
LGEPLRATRSVVVWNVRTEPQRPGGIARLSFELVEKIRRETCRQVADAAFQFGRVEVCVLWRPFAQLEIDLFMPRQLIELRLECLDLSGGRRG